jgi:Predicted integral membrane protein (DUF2269)
LEVSTTYKFWVFVHIVGAFAFVASKGVGWSVDWRLRSQRDPERLRGLLELSSRSDRLAQGGLGLLLLGGIVAGFVGSLWSQAWIWLALLLLVAGSGYPSAVLRKHMRAIDAALNQGERQKLETLLASGRPTMVTTVEMAVMAIIIFLMVFKP